MAQMTKEKKLQILDELIERVKQATHQSSSDMTRCIDEVNSFIRKTMPNDEAWTKRIESVSWLRDNSDFDISESGLANVWNDGKEEFLGVLASIKSEIATYDEPQPDSEQKVKTDKVFIVHGHNDAMKETVARMIEKLGLTPIILHEQLNRGRTIIEKFERLSEDVSFAIALLSADDEMKDGKHRARQNVILELGYFIAKLGRENVIALYDMSSEIEIPSDISGILYEPYDKPDGAWRRKVFKELKECGFAVDANSLT